MENALDFVSLDQPVRFILVYGDALDEVGNLGGAGDLGEDGDDLLVSGEDAGLTEVSSVFEIVEIYVDGWCFLRNICTS